ncbi:MAG TPA: hypothetical protein VFK69_03770, partial [Candidatus Eisenbacteria bacterium]|nr:hypothetical protein [Candidatus Eisenbacteria bacterium]
MSAPDREPARRSDAPDAPPPAHGNAWRALHLARSLEALERALLALAVEPSGAGCSSAWWWVWNPARGALEGWKLAHAGEPDSACRAEERVFADLELSPSDLPEPLASAWGVPASELVSAAGMPWFLAESSAAVLVRRGNAPFGVLVGAWRGAARAPALRAVA